MYMSLQNMIAWALGQAFIRQQVQQLKEAQKEVKEQKALHLSVAACAATHVQLVFQ